MLKTLRIQNIALIPEAEIEFGENLNVLTGETGAGKSIIVGSFNFILGEKLNKNVIRQGANFARVEAAFLVGEAACARIAELCGIDSDDGTVIFTRTLKADGKNECRINGGIVTQAVLRDAAALVINIHGQHETEVLLKPKNHVAILDGFGGAAVLSARGKYEAETAKLKQLERSLQTFGGTDSERKRLADMYEFQSAEIERAGLREGEEEELAAVRSRMMNFEKISNALGSVIAALGGESGVDGGLRQGIAALSGVAGLDEDIEKLTERMKAARIDLQDINDSADSYLSGLEFDEEELRKTDARLDVIKSLKRKYGATVTEVLKFWKETQAQYEFLNRSEEDIARVKKQITEQQDVVAAAADKLNVARKSAAVRLEKEIVVGLRDLGMPNSEFKIEFSGTSLQPQEVEFMFSANKGEAVKPLAAIISGGEMSRFMLSLKVATLRSTQEPAKRKHMAEEGSDDTSYASVTMVFDEIDTGISGTMGLGIASKMAVLSRTHQVITVTHLPQIAAMADTHFVIKKDETGARTLTGVTKLDKAGEVNEIARMIGGAASEQTARDHAKQMKLWAEQVKMVK